ncbi:MAG: NAD(+)/NADH kinase [Solidesulfovibrio sp. DCME]|uniref:NAD(+)/NADH kinase n=1 Tax=Solidesulfovibrio sp. DCME TaxID=3447380 RepID=UPI003D114519
MHTAAILANPASGKDIRRLVAHGSVFDNQEKVRLTRRLLLGLEAAGVGRVLYMPDAYGIVPRALEAIAPALECTPIEMPLTNSQQDTIVAAGIAEALGAGVMVALGGDGTSRAACKGSIITPILPLSTGTNNVFPVMVEATVAGLAAGIVATGRFPLEATCHRATMLEVLLDDAPVDIALVDVAVYDDVFTASRAVWDLDKVPRLFLSRCRADAIGLSAIGGQLAHIEPDEPRGLALELAPDGQTTVTAAIAPGRFARVGVRAARDMLPGQAQPVSLAPCLLAVDGEREVSVARGVRAAVRLTTSGPFVVDVRRVMELARRAGLFVSGQPA